MVVDPPGNVAAFVPVLWRDPGDRLWLFWNQGYGAWWDGDEPAVSYALTYHHRFLGPLDYGLGAFSLDDGRSADDRSQTGAAVSLAVNRTGLGPYMVGHWGVGFRHSDGNPDAYWSLGAGYSIRLLRFLALGVEAAYRVEDRGMRWF